MATATATTGTDNFSGTVGTTSLADTIVISGSSVIQAGDTFNGGSGADTISVSGTADFTVMTAGPQSIEGLSITGATDVTFRANQFGSGLIATSLTLSGDNTARQRVFINDTTNFSAANWVISNWGFSDRIVITAANGVNAAITGSAFHDSLFGGTGNDTLTGGALNDTLIGNDGNDSLNGGTEDDSLQGGNGNDSLFGGDGNDQMFGDADNDTLQGGNGSDSLEGGAGNDFVDGNNGTDTLIGDAGNDTLVGGYTSDSLWDALIDGGDGIDIAQIGSGLLATGIALSLADPTVEQVIGGLTIRNVERLNFQGGSGNDTITGGALQDTINGAGGNDSLSGSGGFDSLLGSNGNDWISGGDSGDFIQGDNNDDTILGDAGDDTIDGGAGNDSIDGGIGSDVISLGDGVNTVRAGDGRDRIIAGSFASGVNDALIDGGAGTDFLQINKAGSSTALAFSFATPNVSQVVDGTIITGFEQGSFTGGTGNDTLTGGALNDLLSGNNGDNLLDGGAGDDTILASTGNDYLIGGLGNDSLFGGNGRDTLDGGDGNDTITSGINEDSISGGDGADFITSGGGNDTIDGGLGNDTITPGDGSDSIMAGGGDDSIVAIGNTGTTFDALIDGGEGIDFARIDRGLETAAMTFSLADPAVSQNLGGTVVVNVERIDLTSGSGNDTLTGGALNDSIQGVAGDDSVSGGGGNDTLVGGNGNDWLSGDDGIDQLFGDSGNDTLLGGDGNDVLNDSSGTDSLAGGEGDDTIISGSGSLGTVDGGNGIDRVVINRSSASVGVAFSLATPSVAQVVDGLSVVNFEMMNFSGSGWHDTITGGILGDTIAGANGNDQIFGSDGDDSLSGGNGNDSIDGGSGNDTIAGDEGADSLLGGDGDDQIFAGLFSGGIHDVMVDGGNGTDWAFIGKSTATTNLTFTLATPAINQVVLGTTIVNIERVSFEAGSGNDTLTGGALNDSLRGGAGNDSLTGGDGNDTLQGDGGVDRLLGGDGDDSIIATGNAAGINDAVIDGGAGTDYAQIQKSGSTASLTFTFATPSVSQTVDGTQIVNVERGVFHSGSGNDTLTGGDLDDNLQGGAGNDSLTGGDGNDLLFAQFGTDTLLGGAGNDYLSGEQPGAGSIFDGGDGIDEGYFIISFGTAQGVFSYADPSAVQVVGGVTITNIERGFFWFSSAGAGTSVIGGAYNDSLSASSASAEYGVYIAGGDGADSLTSGQGNDTIDATGNSAGVYDTSLNGGTGTADLLIADFSNTSVALNIAADSNSYMLAGRTNVQGFERLDFTGSSGNDSLTGGAWSDTLNGGLGNDTLSGLGGDDLIEGSAGDDLLQGGAGDDVLDYSGLSGVTFVYNPIDGTVSKGALGTDTISGFETINFGSNAVLLAGTSGDDTFAGGGGSETLDGGTGNDTLDAGAGNDFLAGGAGNDSLLGNDGDDVIYADAGDDTMDGGTGNDTVNYNGQTGPIIATFGATAGEGTVTGGGFTDLFIGIEGLVGTARADTITGAAASVTITGGGGNDSITGSSADDVFLLGVTDGTDVLDGGDGTDTLRARTANASVNWATTSNVEAFDGAGFANFRIKGTTGADSIDLSAASLTGVERVDGGAGADVITGSAGNDRLFGGTGNDTMDGGDGDDTFLIAFGNGTDSIAGGTGSDTVRAEANSVTVNWAQVSGVEAADGSGFLNFRLTGSAGNDILDFSAVTLADVERIDGGAGADVITGSAGNDRLFGGAGNDTMDGGDGDDTFLIAFGNGTDSIAGGTGSDTVRAEANSVTVDWTQVSGVEAADGGAFLNFRLTGSAGNDLLDFTGVTLSGVERIDGGAGADSITGSAGDDRIMGNAGADLLAGGAGTDTFLYTLATQSTAAAADRITDWQAGDLIDLSAIDASAALAGNQAFTWIGDTAFSRVAGQLRVFNDGTDTFVQADINGDGNADLMIRIDGLQALTAADFAL